jgi:excisionase family DNA binding protein
MTPLARRVPDACMALGIGRSTIYKLASEGKIKLVRIAGRTVVPESEIARLASEGAVMAPCGTKCGTGQRLVS